MKCNSSSLLDRRAFLQVSGLAAAGSCLTPFAKAQDADLHVLRIRKSEIELTAGHRFITTTYNAQFPGPVLRTTVGRPVCVDVCNETDTTEQIHWQGQEVADGAIPPYTWRRMQFTPGRTGLYLYHSEVVAAADLRAGLYSGQSGALLVEAPRTTRRALREGLVVLKGCEPFMRRASSGCEVGHCAVTINGRLAGEAPPLRANIGERVLLHVMNAGAADTYNLELPGHDFEIMALDGVALPAPLRAAALRLSPGERAAAQVVIRQNSRWLVRETEPTATRFAGTNTGTPDETLTLVLARHGAARSGFNRWSINGMNFSSASLQPIFRVTSGAHYRLRIHNTSDEHVPLHLRGHRLQVHGVVKDVVVVGPQQQVEVDFRADGRGSALLHCTRQLQSDFGLRALIHYT